MRTSSFLVPIEFSKEEQKGTTILDPSGNKRQSGSRACGPLLLRSNGIHKIARRSYLEERLYPVYVAPSFLGVLQKALTVPTIRLTFIAPRDINSRIFFSHRSSCSILDLPYQCLAPFVRASTSLPCRILPSEPTPLPSSPPFLLPPPSRCPSLLISVSQPASTVPP